MTSSGTNSQEVMESPGYNLRLDLNNYQQYEHTFQSVDQDEVSQTQQCQHSRQESVLFGVRGRLFCLSYDV